MIAAPVFYSLIICLLYFGKTLLMLKKIKLVQFASKWSNFGSRGYNHQEDMGLTSHFYAPCE